jgi:hypothetical protein
MSDDDNVTSIERTLADRQRMARIRELNAELAELTPNHPHALAEHLDAAYREIDRLRQRLADAGIDDA